MLIISLAVGALVGLGNAQQQPNNSTAPCGFLIDPNEKFDEFAVNEDIVTWRPKKVGAYTFIYSTKDLCSAVNITTKVFVRGPPPPICNITQSTQVALQRGTVTFSSKGSRLSPSYPVNTGVPNLSFKWFWVTAPFGEDRPSFKNGTQITDVTSVDFPAEAGMPATPGTQFKTPELRVSGGYTVRLEVADGFSTASATASFTVTCNCGPSANAGATQTIWSNSPGSGKDGANGYWSNTPEVQDTFTLDATATMDFDFIWGTGETLTYSWTFLEWIPAGVLERGSFTGSVGRDVFNNSFVESVPPPRFIFQEKTNLSATDTSDGFVTILDGSVPLARTYSFVKNPRLVASAWSNTTVQDGAIKQVVIETTSKSGYLPHNNNGQNITDYFSGLTFDKSNDFTDFQKWGWAAAGNTGTGLPPSPPVNPTTTSCAAWISSTTNVTDAITTYNDSYVLSTRQGAAAAGPAGPLIYCSISIKQDSANSNSAKVRFMSYGLLNGKSVDYFEYGRLTGYAGGATRASPLGPFETCRGQWKFQLAVRDGCGAATESTDTITVTVRCNRPPVAVAGKSSYVLYDKTKFPQVTIDGRASLDDDQPAEMLDYYWTFDEYPALHEARGCAGLSGHQPCVQPYCGLVATGNYATGAGNGAATAPTKTFGSSVAGGYVGWDGKKCSPTVYPQIFDLSRPTVAGCTPPGTPLAGTTGYCSYATESPTQFHHGNSAYFVPLAAGTYTVRLIVFDGCSVSTDRVDIIAECPVLSATINITQALSTRGDPLSTVFAPTMSPVSVSATTSYASTSTLSYAWSVVGPANFASLTDRATTFTPTGSGALSVQLSVSDGCQTVKAAPVVFTVTCNSMPFPPSLTATPLPDRGSNVYVYSTTQYTYPTLTVAATATDPEGDAVTISWNVTENGTAVPSTYWSASGNGNSVMSFNPLYIANFNNRVFQVSAFASDPCQRNPSPGVTTLTFGCDATRTVTTLTPNTPQESVYRYQSNDFAAITFDGSASTVAYTNTRKFTWCVAPSGSNCSFNEPAAVSATSTNSAQLSWTPSTAVVSASATDLVFLVNLTVTDGCSASTASTAVTVRCPARPTASLSIETSTVEWDSFASPPAFPAILLNASTSLSSSVRGIDTPIPLAYTFYRCGSTREVATDNSSVPADAAKPAQATFVPTRPGSLTFCLRVSNGPCASVNVAQASVTVQCMSLSVRLRNGNSYGTDITDRGGDLSLSYIWDGVKFPTSCLDGTSISYVTIGDGKKVLPGQAGNYNRLSYTWLINSAPAKSMLKGSSTTTTQSPARGVAPPKERITYETLNDTSTYKLILHRYTQTVRTTVSVLRTTLMNHHYNRPLTCFRPDVVGRYEVLLSVADGCTTATATAVVTAACSPPVVPILSVISGAGTLLERSGSTDVLFNGTKFTRVSIDARAVRPFSSKDTLTYSFTLATKPTGSSTVLSNPQGNIASFVPDAPGTYSINVTVTDGCNPPQNSTMSIRVSCAPQTQVLSTSVQIGAVGAVPNFVAASAEPEIRYSGSTDPIEKFDRVFRLQGNFSQPCQKKESRWYIVRRECTTPSDVAPVATVVPAGTCPNPFKCEWRVSSFPCNRAELVAQGLWKDPTSNNGQFTCNQVGCSLPDSQDVTVGTPAEPGTTNRCRANFQCRTAGTYGLQLIVRDGCQVAFSTTTVVCRCSSRPVITILAQTVVKTCANQKLAFPEKEINPTIDVTDLPRLPACPVPPTPAPTPAPSPVEKCCPAPPACPTCPRCPAARSRGCPACPLGARPGGVEPATEEESSRSMLSKKYQPTAEGQARMGLAKNRKALLNVASSSQSMTAATLLTAQMPMFGLFAMSLLVNLLLVAAIRARRAKRNSRSVLSSNAVKV